MASDCDNMILFEFTDVHLRALNADGTVNSAGDWYKFGCPVEMSLDPEVEEGARVLLKCGGSVANIMQKPDQMTGITAKLTQGKVNPEVESILAGSVGTVVYDASSPPCAIGFNAPTTAEQASAVPFEMRLFEEIVEGSNVVDYWQYSLYYCTAAFPSLSGSQEDYSTPEWTIKAVENTQYDVDESPAGTGKPVYSYLQVAAIP